MSDICIAFKQTFNNPHMIVLRSSNQWSSLEHKSKTFNDSILTGPIISQREYEKTVDGFSYASL